MGGWKVSTPVPAPFVSRRRRFQTARSGRRRFVTVPCPGHPPVTVSPRKRDLMPDALHPNLEGYRVMGEAMKTLCWGNSWAASDRGNPADGTRWDHFLKPLVKRRRNPAMHTTPRAFSPQLLSYSPHGRLPTKHQPRPKQSSRTPALRRQPMRSSSSAAMCSSPRARANATGFSADGADRLAEVGAARRRRTTIRSGVRATSTRSRMLLIRKATQLTSRKALRGASLICGVSAEDYKPSYGAATSRSPTIPVQPPGSGRLTTSSSAERVSRTAARPKRRITVYQRPTCRSTTTMKSRKDRRGSRGTRDPAASRGTTIR